jgi:hypothetical protein
MVRLFAPQCFFAPTAEFVRLSVKTPGDADNPPIRVASVARKWPVWKDEIFCSARVQCEGAVRRRDMLWQPDL